MEHYLHRILFLIGLVAIQEQLFSMETERGIQKVLQSVSATDRSWVCAAFKHMSLLDSDFDNTDAAILTNTVKNNKFSCEVSQGLFDRRCCTYLDRIFLKSFLAGCVPHGVLYLYSAIAYPAPNSSYWVGTARWVLKPFFRAKSLVDAESARTLFLASSRYHNMYAAASCASCVALLLMAHSLWQIYRYDCDNNNDQKNALVPKVFPGCTFSESLRKGDNNKMFYTINYACP